MEAFLGPEDGKIMASRWTREHYLQGLGERGCLCSLPSLTGVIIRVFLHREPKYGHPPAPRQSQGNPGPFLGQPKTTSFTVHVYS